MKVILHNLSAQGCWVKFVQGMLFAVKNSAKIQGQESGSNKGRFNLSKLCRKRYNIKKIKKVYYFCQLLYIRRALEVLGD
jgi:hypothetical protein